MLYCLSLSRLKFVPDLIDLLRSTPPRAVPHKTAFFGLWNTRQVPKSRDQKKKL